MASTSTSSSPAKRSASLMEQSPPSEIRTPRPTFVIQSSEDIEEDAKINKEASQEAVQNGADEETEQVPSIDDQIQLIHDDMDRLPAEGADGFVISSLWLSRIAARGQLSKRERSEVDYPASLNEGPVGMIDNSDIIDADAEPILSVSVSGDEYRPMRAGLTLGKEYNMISSDLFQKLVRWHGIVGPHHSIRRMAKNFSSDVNGMDNIMFEVYPPVFTIHCVKPSSPGFGPIDPKPVRFAISRACRYHVFLTRAKSLLNIPLSAKVKVWLIPHDAAIDQVVIERADFDQIAGKEHLQFVDSTAAKNYNGHLNLNTAGLIQDSVIVIDVVAGLTGSAPGSGAASPKVATLSDGTPAETQCQVEIKPSRLSRYFPDAGLTNMGNTCYMNSAIQCLRAVEELSLYFLSGKLREELNESNPLGYRGNIANRYSDLLHSLFTTSTTFRPSGFRSTIGNHNPAMQNWQQQDSQEFLSFLTDGLHEDLNRIHKKPYIEYPDSDNYDVGDPAAIAALGEKYQEIHAARNDSVVMDLFNGFYKNTVVCPICDKISVTFDPYTSVTLQLPQTKSYTVVYVPAFGRPVKLEVEADRGFTVRSLKEHIADKIKSARPDAMVMAEVYQHSVHKVFPDRLSLLEARIQASDMIIVYQLDEVPTNYPSRQIEPARNRTMVDLYDSSEDDENKEAAVTVEAKLFCVLSRIPRSGNGQSSTGRPMVGALYPIFITLSAAEARSLKTVTKKILLKISQLTTVDLFGLAKSAMADEEDTDGLAAGNVDVDFARLFLEETTEIPERLHDLFDLKAFRVGPSIIPNEFGRSELNRATLLSDRERTMSQSDLTASQTSRDDSIRSGESSADESTMTPNPAATPPSETESESTRHYSAHKASRAKDLDRKAKRKTGWAGARYGTGRRMEKALRPRPRAAPVESDEDVDKLVRNGEALIVDWDGTVFHDLFGRLSAQDSTVGVDAIEGAEFVDSPTLHRQRELRARRLKDGVTLDECLDETTKREVLSAENAWYCSTCKERRRASKTLEIWTLPEILVVHLKRFHTAGAARHKLSLLVDFPLDGLDLTSRVGRADGRDYMYDLIGIDNHYGDLGGGHYTAYAKSFLDGRWYDYNDSSVRPVSNLRSMVTGNAYLLFYRRRSATPLGPTYLSDLVINFRNGDETGQKASNDSPRSTSSAESSSRSFLSRGIRSLNSTISAGTDDGKKLNIRSLSDRATRSFRRILSSDQVPDSPATGTDTGPPSVVAALPAMDGNADPASAGESSDGDENGRAGCGDSVADPSDSARSGIVTPADSSDGGDSICGTSRSVSDPPAADRPESKAAGSIKEKNGGAKGGGGGGGGGGGVGGKGM